MTQICLELGLTYLAFVLQSLDLFLRNGKGLGRDDFLYYTFRSYWILYFGSITDWFKSIKSILTNSTNNICDILVIYIRVPNILL